MDWAMDWTNEFTLEFLKLYKNEPVLWNPKHANYKDRKYAYASWDRLSDLTELSVEELKRKKDSLMATFRAHLRKRKSSLENGDTTYAPIWFAYDFMEDFLSPVYGVKRERRPSEETFSDDGAPDAPIPKSYIKKRRNQLNISTASESRTQTSMDSLRRRRDPPELQDDPPEKLSNMTKEPKRYNGEELDECDLYGQILAKKLRRLPELDRTVLMHDIDGMVINALRSYLDPSFPLEPHDGQ